MYAAYIFRLVGLRSVFFNPLLVDHDRESHSPIYWGLIQERGISFLTNQDFSWNDDEGWFIVDLTTVNGVYKPTNITGRHHFI